jgi:hypothetical protein
MSFERKAKFTGNWIGLGSTVNTFFEWMIIDSGPAE